VKFPPGSADTSFVALQGTLDTFALPDVLRLLASTKKTGRLHVVGARGSGDVWVRDGSVVGVDTAVASDTGVVDGSTGDVMFELFRLADDAFEFEPDTKPSAPTSPLDVEALLADVEERLAEWRAIEAVVPSLDYWVVLTEDLPAKEVTIDATTWKTIVAVGSGRTVGDLGNDLGLGEVAVSRAVKDLVEARLAEVALIDEAVLAELELNVPTHDESDEAPDAGPARVELDAMAAEYVAEEPETDDEVVRQLAALSPKAARAVAAAAHAETDEEREAALAEAESEGGEQINRGMLLRFLSSVKS
jgi:hypothetical protein